MAGLALNSKLIVRGNTASTTKESTCAFNQSIHLEATEHQIVTGPAMRTCSLTLNAKVRVIQLVWGSHRPRGGRQSNGSHFPVIGMLGQSGPGLAVLRRLKSPSSDSIICVRVGSQSVMRDARAGLFELQLEPVQVRHTTYDLGIRRTCICLPCAHLREGTKNHTTFSKHHVRMHVPGISSSRNIIRF